MGGVILMPLFAQAQAVELPKGTALRVEVDHAARIRPGARVEEHLLQPVYLVDHEVIPKGRW